MQSRPEMKGSRMRSPTWPSDHQRGLHQCHDHGRAGRSDSADRELHVQLADQQRLRAQPERELQLVPGRLS
jgi:hypothetical protein